MKNNDKWMNELLLQQSGELSRWRQRRLQRQLRTDPCLQAEQARLQKMQSHLQASVPNHAVSDFCMSRIQEAAMRQLDRPQPSAGAIWKWQPAVAYAGVVAVLLVVGVWFLQQPSDPPIQVAVPPEATVPWMPMEWDAIFAEIAWDAYEKLDELWMDVNEMVLWTTDQYEEEWARELLKMETST